MSLWIAEDSQVWLSSQNYCIIDRQSAIFILAIYLHNRLFKTIPKADSYIKNSFELVEKLKKLHITSEHKLISLDVTSLFMNVPMDIAVDCVNEQWNFISKDCSCLRTTY